MRLTVWFKTTDQIARAFDIAFDDEQNQAGILYILHEAGIKDGHLFLDIHDLIGKTIEVLATPEGLVKSDAIVPVLEKWSWQET